MSANPLHAMHEQAEAAFLPYGPDLEIVESFGEVEAEYAAIRKAAALLDAPHRSVIILTGKDRLAFLQNLLTNNVKKLSPGQGCYAYLLSTKGRIVFDANVLQMEDATLLELDARVAANMTRELEKYLFAEDVKILDASGQLGRFTLIGPNAAQLLNKVSDAGIATLDAPLQSAKRSINKSTVTLFRNDQCGEPQYELIMPRDQLVALWQVLHEAGNGHGEPQDSGINLRAIGWSAFNMARIEAGTPMFGIDITDQYLPMETGPWYARAVEVAKGCYLGQEIVARMHAHNSVARMLVGLRIGGSGPDAVNRVPVAGTDILDKDAVAGIITSSCVSPMLGFSPVALGYVKRALSVAGSQVEVLAQGRQVAAVVVELPLWKKTPA